MALLVALGVDNAGSGLFLPLVLVYCTEAVGLSLAVAGTLVSVGTAMGLVVPAVAGRVIDRLGPKAVVVASQVLQAGGLLAYLLAQDVTAVAVAAALTTVGLQLFYSALFALIADAAPPGPRDHAFAVVDMVRAGAFGAGALVAGALLTALDATGLRMAVALDATTLVLAALLLVLFVHPRHHIDDGGGHGENGGGLETVPPQARPLRGVLRDRPFLVLILATGLIGLASDVFSIGLPVVVLDQLNAPGWVPGVCLALLTLAVSTLAAAVVRATARYSRLQVIGIGAAVTLLWCAVTASALAVPSSLVPAWLLASTLVLAASSLLVGTRPNAVAEAAAPVQLRGRYLAVFQYAFTVPQLAAPLVMALSAVHPVLPWVTTAATTTAGLGLLPWLARRLPTCAVQPTG